MSKNEHPEIRFDRDVDLDSVIRLYRQAGWWEEGAGDDRHVAAAIVQNSLCFAGAFAGGRLVGMARAISDGVSDAYIQDVTVAPELRGRGIGRRLVQAVAAELRRRGIGWIGLIAQPGTEAFYEKLGFTAMAGHVPMRLKRP